MHKRIILWGAALLLSGVFAAATNGANTTIDFNSFSPNIYTSISASGVTFVPVDPGGSFSVQDAGPNGSRALLGEGSPRTAIRANISGGTTFVSVDLGDFNSDPDLFYLRAFNSSNVLLGSSTLAVPDSDTSMHTLSVSAANIDHVEWGASPPSLNGSSVYGDKFTFAVPEPIATAPLAAATLILWRSRSAPRRWSNCK